MLTLVKPEAPTFNFQIEGDETVYSMPLATALPVKTVKTLYKLNGMDDGDALDFFIDLIEQYCPGITDRLTLEQFAIVFEKYGEASNEAGATLGE